MAGSTRKRQAPKKRLPPAAPGMPGVSARLAPVGRRPPVLEDDSIYTLRGYKAWAARVTAAWDAES
mgnify:CR=1 FL=1